MRMRRHTEPAFASLRSAAWRRFARDIGLVALSDPAAREVVYGMPHEAWKAKYQKGDGIPALRELAVGKPGDPHKH